MKSFKFILRRINSFLCDLALVYALFYLLLFVRPTGFSISATFFISAILYFGLSYWLFSVSFMQKLFCIKIFKHNFGYVLFKIIFVGIIPFFIAFFFYEIFIYFYLFLYLVVTLLLTIIFLLFTKKSLWQLCSGAQVVLQEDPYKKKSPILILLAVIIALLFYPAFFSNFRFNIAEYFQNNKNAAFPISIPEKNYYVKNIRQYKEEPVNYVMQLFDKYDIVILCERLHPETTQWDFFSKIVLNDTFATKVGNVFTEVGNVQYQEQLDTYINTHFSSEEDLQRATAAVARENAVWPLWNNTNIYDFILHLHQFNESRDSAGRINLYFTDSTIDWNKINNPRQRDSLLRHTNRDSLMAYHVINQYGKLATHKCLLITNTRHAWNYGDNVKQEKNEAAYIFDKFPNKTAVVLINGMAQLWYPPMKGTLDAAALEILDSIWAIDFKNCPLGNTLFDLMPNKRDKCTYKDLFTGMVYCKHPSEWIFSENYPFILDNFQDIFLKRSALVGDEYLKNQKKMIKKGYYDTIYRRQSPIFVLTNLSFLAIHSIILLYLFLNLLIKLLSLLFRKNKVNTE